MITRKTAKEVVANKNDEETKKWVDDANLDELQDLFREITPHSRYWIRAQTVFWRRLFDRAEITTGKVVRLTWALFAATIALLLLTLALLVIELARHAETKSDGALKVQDLTHDGHRDTNSGHDQNPDRPKK